MEVKIAYAVERLRALLNNPKYQTQSLVDGRTIYDFEALHIEADKIILEILPYEIIDAYEEVEKKCGGFVHA